MEGSRRELCSGYRYPAAAIRERSMGALSEVEQEGIRRRYSDFNRREIDAILDRLAEDVR